MANVDQHSETSAPAEPVPGLAAGERLKVPWVSRLLIFVASVLAVAALASAWANRQLLNTDDWTRTSSDLLENRQIQSALSTYLVDQLFASVNVKAELQQQLPPNLKGLAGPAAGGLREVADRASTRALASPVVQAKWEDINRVAHKRFKRVIEGGGKNVSTQNGVVTLDVRALIADLATRLGIGANLAAKLPASAGQIEIVRSDELKAVQDGADLLGKLVIVLTIFVPLLYVLAVWRAGAGRRRRALLGAGVGLAVASLVVLVVIRIAGSVVVNQLAHTPSGQDTVQAAWGIATSLLREIGRTGLIFGVLIVLGAWLAGPARPAVGFRRLIAPYLKEWPAVAYGVVFLLALVVLAVGPPHVTGRIVPIVILFVLAGLGVFFLRKQVVQEFPEASVEAAREWRRERIERWRASREARRAGPPPAPEAGAGHAAELERLADLRSRGILTEEEFASEKHALLTATPPARAT